MKDGIFLNNKEQCEVHEMNSIDKSKENSENQRNNQNKEQIDLKETGLNAINNNETKRNENPIVKFLQRQKNKVKKKIVHTKEFFSQIGSDLKGLKGKLPKYNQSKIILIIFIE